MKIRGRAKRKISPLSAPVELRGRGASPGFAAGPLFRLDVEIARRLPTGDPQREREALQEAVVASIGQIERLTAESNGEEAAILEFQSAMLSDDELIAPALSAIDSGVTAEAAWLSALFDQIAGYETADDDY